MAILPALGAGVGKPNARVRRRTCAPSKGLTQWSVQQTVSSGAKRRADTCAMWIGTNDDVIRSNSCPPGPATFGVMRR